MSEIRHPLLFYSIMAKKEKFVVSLGGSIAFPNGPDIQFLKDFCQLIVDETQKGNQFAIVVGGGGIARQYQKASLEISKVSPAGKDWMGIYANRLHAIFLREILKPLVPEVFFDEKGRKKSFSDYKILLLGGGKPGGSSDLVAVKKAADLGLDAVINLSKPDYVYTVNPDDDKTAKPIERLTWSEFFKLVPEKWSPGMQTPFDPVAGRLAQKNHLKVIVAGGRDLPNFEKILAGEKFKGTIIKN